MSQCDGIFGSKCVDIWCHSVRESWIHTDGHLGSLVKDTCGHSVMDCWHYNVIYTCVHSGRDSWVTVKQSAWVTGMDC